MPDNQYTDDTLMLAQVTQAPDSQMLQSDAGFRPTQRERRATGCVDPASSYKFERYDVRHDWTQYTDVAEANPAKLREMRDLM